MNETEAAAVIAIAAIAPDLTMTATFVPWSLSRNAGEKQPSLNWKVNLKTPRGQLETDYMQGIGHLPHYQHAFAHIVVYDDAVRHAAETGKTRIRPAKNAYDACHAGEHRPNASIPIPPPLLPDVLHSLLSDASAIDCADFEEWASDLGYDTDSRKAEHIYRACLETGLKLRSMLGDETLQQLRTALADW